MFANLRKNGFQLNHPDSRLYVCPQCIPNTDVAVATTMGYDTSSFHVMNVKRDVPMAHKKLLPSKVAKSAVSLVSTREEGQMAMQLSSPQQHSSNDEVAEGTTETTSKDLAIVQAAQEIPVVRDFLADKTRRSASLMGRKGTTAHN